MSRIRKRTPLTRAVEVVSRMLEVDTGGRSHDSTTARSIAMYVVREATGASLARIGQAFGGRHHTSVRTAVIKAEKLRQQDPEIDTLIRSLLRAADSGRHPAGLPPCCRDCAVYKAHLAQQPAARRNGGLGTNTRGSGSSPRPAAGTLSPMAPEVKP
ncbi:MAG: hypothetical protein FJW34_12735 [Acidobacteria bacterium]|nr:hypothetical protein [Acidobacteriota bacterium]